MQRGAPFHKVNKPFDHMLLQGPVKYFSCVISTITRPMSIKLGKVVTYYKQHQPIVSSIMSRDEL